MSPIDCKEVLREIELYLDGELLGGDCTEIEAHLSACGPCMDRSEFRRRLRELLARSCACDEVPPGLRERVDELLHGPDAPA